MMMMMMMITEKKNNIAAPFLFLSGVLTLRLCAGREPESSKSKSFFLFLEFKFVCFTTSIISLKFTVPDLSLSKKLNSERNAPF